MQINIWTDEEQRQGLNNIGQPTHNCMHMDAELSIGGIDIVREMVQDGSLKAAGLATTTTSTSNQTSE
jgi:glutaredoxin-related protein